MVFPHRNGVVLIGTVVPVLMRNIGAEIEQLKGGKNAGKYPKQQKILQRKENVEYLQGDSIQNKLLDADVLLEETPIPLPEMTGFMVVRIFVGGYKTMVFVMLNSEFIRKN